MGKKETKVNCKLKGKWIEIDHKEGEGKKIRAFGIKVENKFKLNQIQVPHKRVKVLLTDFNPEVLSHFGGKFLYHHTEYLFLDFSKEKKKKSPIAIKESVIFQIEIEPWLNKVFKEWINLYGIIQEKKGKKYLKQKKEEIKEKVLKGLIEAFKETDYPKFFVILSLFINKGDIFYFLISDNPDFRENLPWLSTPASETRLKRISKEFCSDIISFFTYLPDHIYHAYLR
jgi:hypothetical protein